MDQKCNTYSFADMAVGMMEQFECIITQEMQDAFTGLSGDINPMHIDNDFANRCGGGGSIVVG